MQGMSFIIDVIRSKHHLNRYMENYIVNKLSLDIIRRHITFHSQSCFASTMVINQKLSKKENILKMAK